MYRYWLISSICMPQFETKFISFFHAQKRDKTYNIYINKTFLLVWKQDIMCIHVHGNWTGKFFNNAHKANECHPWKITLSPIKIYFKWISLFARVHELAIYIYKHITLATATPTNNKRKTELCCSFMNPNNNLDYQIQAIYIIASLMIPRKYHLMFVNE